MLFKISGESESCPQSGGSELRSARSRGALISKYGPAPARLLLAVPPLPDFDTNNQIGNQGGEKRKKKKPERERERKKKEKYLFVQRVTKLAEWSRYPERPRDSRAGGAGRRQPDG